MSPNPFLDIGLGDLLPLVGLVTLFLWVLSKKRSGGRADRAKAERQAESRQGVDWRAGIECRLARIEGRLATLEGRIATLEGRREET